MADTNGTTKTPAPKWLVLLADKIRAAEEREKQDQARRGRSRRRKKGRGR